jgi:hypothetical protein
MSGCTLFNAPFVLNAVTSIQSNFLLGCEKFNHDIFYVINELKEFHENFLKDCNSYNSNLNLQYMNASILPSGFMQNCYSMTSIISFGTLSAPSENMDNTVLSMDNDTCDAYKTGIKIDGRNKNAIKDKIPNSSSNPFRKIII